VAMLLLVPIVLGFGAGVSYLKAASARVEAQTKAGEKPTRLDQQLHEVWTKHVRDEIVPSEEKRREEWDKAMAAYRGGYFGIIKKKAFELFMEHTVAFLIGGFLVAASRMLIGMGLMKLGVFSAQRSLRFYWWMLSLGYGIGIPLMIFDAIALIKYDFSTMYMLRGSMFYNVYGSMIVALGHVGLLMLIVQKGALTWLTGRLAAVGRMALSNYLFHSIFCTTLFYGYGFGLFGHINRTGLACIVVAIWVFQLLVSPIWLNYFRYGPAEWLWRSLTYWRIQNFRQQPDEALVGAA